MKERRKGNEGKEKRGREEEVISEELPLLINHCLWNDHNERERETGGRMG